MAERQTLVLRDGQSGAGDEDGEEDVTEEEKERRRRSTRGRTG